MIYKYIHDDSSKQKEMSPTPRQIAMSVLAAAIGVQSSKNRERDFNHGNPVVFIVAGLIFTLIFVLTILLVVYLVL